MKRMKEAREKQMKEAQEKLKVSPQP